MRLIKLVARNYKSLRNITFTPSPFSVLVGSNAAGKTNFADSIHFLSEVYSQGLEVAIARKGGYENIAFRKQRRSKANIEFEITLDINADHRRIKAFLISFPMEPFRDRSFRLIHKFSISASGSGIKAAFRIKEESFCVFISKPNSEESEEFIEVAKISRNIQNRIKVEVKAKDALSDRLKKYEQFLTILMKEGVVGEQNLVMNNMPLGRAFSDVVSGFEVYQFSTTLSRAPGVPTPNPTLSISGENLPALVDWLQRGYPKQWEIVMSGMKDIVPGLADISIQYLHTKTLGLFFSEEGVGRPWGADEVSDGTIRALAILVASVDPRSSLLVIEEPENSVHPWIIRTLVERLRKVSESKNVVITTHSPVLINLLNPEEIWITFRKKGETQLRRLTYLDISVREDWARGDYQLYDFLDSGSVSEAVPGGVF